VVKAESKEDPGRESAFGKGYWLFFGFAGGLFAAIAIAIPMVLITSASSSQPTNAPPPTVAPVLSGEGLAVELGCVACHTTDGTNSAGPTWAGLAGSDRLLDSGETVVADDPYLLRSIVDPPAQVVAGFNPIMPTGYGDRLTDEEITDLVDYINSLG